MVDGGVGRRIGRWAWHAAMMPHRTTEALMRLDNIEARLQAGSPGNAAAASQVYRGYTDADLVLLHRFAAPSPPAPGFITDYFGVRTRTDYVRGTEGLGGTVRGLPVPDDGWHAETIEYVGLLKAVAGAQGRYACLELGAGWGPWLVAGAVVARRLGIADLRLSAVEADPGHFAFLEQHLRDNGFDPATHRLQCAAVGVADGTARWPHAADPAAQWGSRPIEADGHAGRDHVGRPVAEWVDVPVVGIAGVLREQPHWDLVHIDVQGWEATLCAEAGALLDARVRWLIVATHDAKLHGDVMDQMFRHGWALENEKPPRFTWTDGATALMAMTTQDGTQVWRNQKLISSQR